MATVVHKENNLLKAMHSMASMVRAELTKHVQYSACELLTQPPVRCAGLDQSTQVLTPI